MMYRVEIQADKLELTDKLRTYVTRKIGKLDTFLPRTARLDAHAEVYLRQAKAYDKPLFTARAVLYLPHKTIEASETTINIFAAIDVAHEKLRAQLRQYKDEQGGHAKRRLFARARSAGKV